MGGLKFTVADVHHTKRVAPYCGALPLFNWHDLAAYMSFFAFSAEPYDKHGAFYAPPSNQPRNSSKDRNVDEAV